MDILENYLQHFCGVDNVKRNEPLSRWTTFRVGGPARYFVLVKQKETLVRLIKALKYLDYPYFILGLGANVLASDQGFDGVVMKLEFQHIEQNDVFLYADAGAKLGAVVNFARDHSLAGLAWAAGIPATIGGGVYMNCGAFGHSLSDVVVMVDVIMDGENKTLTRNQLDFSYRHSIFMDQSAVIIGAYLRLAHGDSSVISAEMQTIIEKRRQQPHEPSAGSVFKRPEGNYAGTLIESAGLKGTSIGGAQVSELHAGFIVNKGGATAQDVLSLIKLIRERVFEMSGIMLEPEVRFVGRKKTIAMGVL